MKGNYQEGIDLLETNINIGSVGFGRVYVVNHSYFKLGKTAKAQELAMIVIGNVMSNYNNDPNLIDTNFHLTFLAYQYSILGQQTEAIDYLERAIDMGWGQSISNDIYLNPFTTTPASRNW